jgi:hypothetical protein
MVIAYARRKLLHGLPVRRHHYRLATSALERIAVRVKHLPNRPGRPWLWVLKAEGMSADEDGK